MDFNKNRAPLYDMISVSTDNAGTRFFNGESQFFAIAKGQSGKTYADTNILTPRQLPRGSAFRVKRIGVQVFPGVNPSVYGALAASQFLNDVYQVFKNGTLAVQGLDDKVILRVPVSLLPGSTKLHMVSTALEGIADAAGVGLNNQYAAIDGETFDLAEPLDLIGGENFGAVLEMPATLAVPSNTDIKVKLIYEGVYATPKQ